MPDSAAFGRLCVETFVREGCGCGIDQPPSGGCVLKQLRPRTGLGIQTAAFGRLCVETTLSALGNPPNGQPPSGGCVLKPKAIQEMETHRHQPPSGGCVLKRQRAARHPCEPNSRLRAAVC